jgi:hypothetical protein
LEPDFGSVWAIAIVNTHCHFCLFSIYSLFWQYNLHIFPLGTPALFHSTQRPG